MWPFSAIGKWRTRRRAQRELDAFEELKAALTAEEAEIKSIAIIITQIEGFIRAHKFVEAEQIYRQRLMPEINKRKREESLERMDLRKLKKTMMKRIRADLKAVRKAS